MVAIPKNLPADKRVHSWLRKIGVAFVPGPMSPLLEGLADGLLNEFRRQGHAIKDAPDEETDIILTTAPYGVSLNWREALLFSARRRFKLKHTPVIYTLVQLTREKFDKVIARFERALKKDPPDVEDFTFEGLSPHAPHVLIEQGLRGGPIMALERLVQSQTKSIRVLLAVGDERPEQVYHFDLVGAYPASAGEDYQDMVLRIVTTESTREITDHEMVGEPIPADLWRQAPAPEAMKAAGRQIGQRGFFTDMVRVADLVAVPAVDGAIASQYSEGCFATWDPVIEGLAATVTGSARPVDKGNISDDDLAVIVGVRPDGEGAQVRHVEGKRNDPPSSEAVEMMDMDMALPHIKLGEGWEWETRVPVVRSKLHGHRGVRAYHPELVEWVPLDPPFYHYLVSCATEAQAHGIKEAFARAECLLDPGDPRQVAFTVLPGHGVVIAEKWVPGKQPFQTIWEFMDEGHLEIDNHIPQGLMGYELGEDGRMTLEE